MLFAVIYGIFDAGTCSGVPTPICFDFTDLSVLEFKHETRRDFITRSVNVPCAVKPYLAAIPSVTEKNIDLVFALSEQLRNIIASDAKI